MARRLARLGRYVRVFVLIRLFDVFVPLRSAPAGRSQHRNGLVALPSHGQDARSLHEEAVSGRVCFYHRGRDYWQCVSVEVGAVG